MKSYQNYNIYPILWDAIHDLRKLGKISKEQFRSLRGMLKKKNDTYSVEMFLKKNFGFKFYIIGICDYGNWITSNN